MLKINIGLSKKVGEANYGSRGATVSLELEAETGLASDPERLRERIRFLFDLAKASVEEELHGHAANGHASANGQANGNGNGRRNGRQDKTRPATASQVRALLAIAQRLNMDATRAAQDRYGVDRLEDLAITEASELIDELKAQGSSNGTGSRR